MRVAAGVPRALDTMIRHFHVCADALDDREPSDLNGLRLSRTGSRWVLSGDLDDLAGTTVDAAISATLDGPAPVDRRSASTRRRADTLVAISRAYLDTRRPAGRRRRTAAGECHDRVGDDPGRAPLPARRRSRAAAGPTSGSCCADANVARILTAPDGAPLDIGHAARTAPRWMRHAIAVRDQGCRFPGCDRRPSRCEAHHVWAWEQGEAHAVANLVLLCPFHHHLLHRRGWTDTPSTASPTPSPTIAAGSSAATSSGVPPPLSAAAA